jgi:hypothetical protein
MFVSLEHLQKFAKAVTGYPLCPECARRYTPALVVELWTGGPREVMHFAEVPYYTTREYQPPEDCGYWRYKELVWFEDFLDHDFLRYLMKRYPALIDRPLTECALREVGCDIEAEWALWRLGNQ